MPKRDIALPPVHNTRAPEQWCIILKHVDFEGKTVLDLGCGYGDLLWRAWEAGAKHITGVEGDWQTQKELGSLAWKMGISMRDTGDFIPCYAKIENILDLNWRADIIICFSVLPYLTDPTATLRWICEHSSIALIECQLSGDGPGFDWLKSPQDMRRWLDSTGWKSVQRIGETVVKDRGAKRGIWLCSS